ncbi:unnamed protein product [Effrenium voratum]|nr:unnamed protein product [Effrenium voratum]
MAFRDLPALLKWSSKVRTWKPLKPRSKPSISAELPKGQGRLRVAASHSSDRLRPDAELLQEGFLPGAMSSPSRWQDSKLPQATERGEQSQVLCESRDEISIGCDASVVLLKSRGLKEECC